MDCAQARALALEAVTGTTAPDLRRRLAEHLATCAACRAEAARLEQTALMLRARPEPRVADGFWADFMVGLDRRLASDRRRIWPRVTRWLHNPAHAWSAAVAMLALVVVLAVTLTTPPPQQSLIPDDDRPVVAEGMMTEAMVRAMPGMNASLAVWKAGLGASEVSYELTGDR